MKRQYLEDDYSSVVRSRSRRAEENVVAEPKRIIAVSNTPNPPPFPDQAVNDNATFLGCGHAVSFALLFLFTVVLYARPAEFYPSAITNSLALIIGVILLATFAATQIALEGSLTARPPEVNLLLLFTLTAALSIPLAIDPLIARHEFSGTFIRAIFVFVVMVNVVRTEARLKVMLAVSIFTALLLSIGAINEYRLGLDRKS